MKLLQQKGTLKLFCLASALTGEYPKWVCNTVEQSVTKYCRKLANGANEKQNEFVLFVARKGGRGPGSWINKIYPYLETARVSLLFPFFFVGWG